MLWECKISSSTKYLWCYVDSDMSSWETCGCKLRQDFINYWGMLRRELVKPKPKPLKVSGSPLTPREIALVSAMASLTIIMGLLLMALAVQFKRMKNQQPQLFGNGIFIHNPIYQAPNGNAPDEQWNVVDYGFPNFSLFMYMSLNYSNPDILKGILKPFWGTEAIHEWSLGFWSLVFG